MSSEVIIRERIRRGHKQDAVEVAFDPAERWAVGAQPLWPGRRGFPVRATLHDQAFDTAIVSRSRRHWLLLPPDVEQAAGVGVGEMVELRLSPSDALPPASSGGTAER